MNSILLPEPVIFLDIDGVLTNMTETPGSWLNHTPNEYGLSPSNVLELKTLIELTHAKVVISSNWRKFPLGGQWSFNGYTFTSPLSNVIDMLGDAFISTLPPLRHCTKSESLLYWFNENNIDFLKSKYVIFDDDPDEGFAISDFKDHYIETDPEIGLTKVNAITAFNMLT